MAELLRVKESIRMSGFSFVMNASVSYQASSAVFDALL
jgi:hypothetical protein